METTKEVLESYIEDGNRWAIELKEEGKVIGSIMIYPDENHGKYYAKSINYYLSEEHWNKGYMTEAIKRVITYAFEEIDIDLLSAFHIPNNSNSKRVLEKNGFEYEGTIKQGYQRYDGQTFDSVCYSILKTDYYSNKL